MFVNPQVEVPVGCEANLSPWLVDPPSVPAPTADPNEPKGANMAHILSTQLAAFWLNTHVTQQCNGDSSGDGLCCPGTAIYVDTTAYPQFKDLADARGFVSVEDIINQAKGLLCSYVFPTPGTDVHSQMALLADFFDLANNNMFQMVSAQPCAFTPDCPCAPPSECIVPGP